MVRRCFFIVAAILGLMLASCTNDDGLTDKDVTVTLYVSSQTGSRTSFGIEAHECMLVKEKGEALWNPWEFKGIKGFTYEKGCSYELLVTKTIYANPPADGSSYDYTLIRVVSKTSPENP